MRLKILGLTTIMMLLFNLSCLAAYENLEFVDANGKTGYYVDRKSAYFVGDSLAEAIIVVKKAGQNRMFSYTMRFDREHHTYQILSSQVIEYDTRTVLERQGESGLPQPYRLQSPMNEIVDYIFSARR